MTEYPYDYSSLLSRLQQIKTMDDIKTKNSLPPIQVAKKNKNSIIINFQTYGDLLKRPLDQISRFYKEETGLCNSINIHNQLIIQGSLNENQCENILRNYIKSFVLCKQCKNIDTHLFKEDGLTFLICQKCSAKTSLGKMK